MRANALPSFQIIFGPNSNPFTTWTPFCVGTADDNSALNAADDWRGASQSGETMAGMLATGATGHTIAGLLAASVHLARMVGRQKSKYSSDDVGGVFLRTASTPRAGDAASSTSSSASSTWSSKVVVLHTYSCFFLCGMCLTYPWNAINAAVGALSEALGKSAYVYIQGAYYLPLLPCLLLQTKCDARYDARYGLRAAYG